MAKEQGNLRFCLKAICLWEAQTGRSYQSINLEEQEDLQRLLYSMYLSERSNQPQSYDAFVSVLGKGSISELLLLEARNALQVSHELCLRGDEASAEQGAMAEEAESTTSISSVLARLVIEGGISAEYVYYDMGLWELPLYLKALADKRHEDMERERLWCFLSLLPHVSGDVLRKPEDLLRFPHEQAEEEAEELRQDELYRLMGSL